MTRSRSRAASVTTPTRVQTTPRMLNRKSWNLRRAMSRVRFSWFILVRLPEALAQDVAGDVEHQRYHEQGQSRGEDRLVADAAVRQIAEADLDDEGGDGRRRVARVEREGRL